MDRTSRTAKCCLTTTPDSFSGSACKRREVRVAALRSFSSEERSTALRTEPRLTIEVMSGLESLRLLSARIGRDLNLVQAGGGNTSWKDGDTLWVKASGKWLIRAAEEEMFLPAPLSEILQGVAEDRDYTDSHTVSSGESLRPSVETTMHAVLPHPVVIHVHSVNTISWAVRPDGAEALRAPLNGLRWEWIPYIHPGLPLARRIEQALESKPDVLILANHGLVVGGKNCEAAESLLADVERRLGREPLPSRPAISKHWRNWRTAQLGAPLPTLKSTPSPSTILRARLPRAARCTPTIASIWALRRLRSNRAKRLRIPCLAIRRATAPSRLCCWRRARASWYRAHSPARGANC